MREQMDSTKKPAAGIAVLLGLPLLLLFVLFAAAGPASAAPCDSLQARIDAAPSGGTVVAEEGCVYRERITINKPITIVGDPGAEIRGSDVWTAWTKRKDGRWISTLTVPAFPETMDQIVCMPKTNRCHWPEQVFFNGKPMTQVGSLTAVKRGKFYVTSGRKIVLGSDPSGKMVEVTMRREWVVGSDPADGVVIDNVNMSHAANSGRTAALLNRPEQTERTDAGSNWTVKNSTLSDAHGAVISLSGGFVSSGFTGHNILDNRILRGGQLNIHGAADGSIISGNEIAFGNTERYCYGVDFCGATRGIGETGGAKLAAFVDDTVFTDNAVHDNFGHGIHYDAECSNNTISNNRVYNNARMGIQYELCYSGSISGNVIYNNGWATPEQFKGGGIVLPNSSSTEIYNNTLAWNADGIAVIGSDRAGTAHDLVHDVYVHNNTILSSSGSTEKTNNVSLAWTQGWSKQLFDPDYNNRGERNRYWYTSPQNTHERFKWRISMSKLSEFNGTRGEENGRYLTTEEKRAVVRAKGLPASP